MEKDKNIIQEFLNDVLGECNQFNPNKHFYTNTNIGSKRWGMIYRNEKSPTLKELNNIALYFGKTLNVISEKRQLKLWSEDILKGDN